MTQKFNYDGYTVCVTFRSDNALTMTASHNLTGEHFIHDMIELGKIKKDTVLATLGRKSEKHLWCTFKMVDSKPRKLLISFVVKFDFLPEFSEDVTLDHVEVKGEVFNKISSAEFKSDIDEIEKVLDSIKDKGAITIEEKTSSVTRKTPITEFELRKGAFLLQLTGVLTNASAVGDTIQFTIEQEGEEPIVLKQKSHSQHGYAYPFFMSHKLESKGGCVKIHG